MVRRLSRPAALDLREFAGILAFDQAPSRLARELFDPKVYLSSTLLRGSAGAFYLLQTLGGTWRPALSGAKGREYPAGLQP